MKTIWKFNCPIRDLAVLDMPQGAKPISVLNQNENLVIYAEVVDEYKRPRVQRHFRIAGTGHPLGLPVNAVFIGTVSFREGSLIFHIYDLGEE